MIIYHMDDNVPIFDSLQVFCNETKGTCKADLMVQASLYVVAIIIVIVVCIIIYTILEGQTPKIKVLLEGDEYNDYPDETR